MRFQRCASLHAGTVKLIVRQGGAGSPPPDPRGYPRPGGERPADPGAEEADDAEGSEGLGNVLEGAVAAAGSAESVELGECESLFQLLCSPSRELSYGPWPFRLLDFPALGAAEVHPSASPGRAPPVRRQCAAAARRVVIKQVVSSFKKNMSP